MITKKAGAIPPEDYLRGGLAALREGRYFDAHEDWEIPWKDMTGDIRSFWQAMIQLSVGAYHFQNANLTGCRNLWNKALTRCRNISNADDVRDLEIVHQLDAVLQNCLDTVAKDGDPLPHVLHFAQQVVTDDWYHFQ